MFFSSTDCFLYKSQKDWKKKKQQKSTQYSKSNKVESRIRKIKVIPK